MQYKTTLTAKANVINPNSNEFKAIASSLKDKYGFDLKPQMDLLYVRSCLVSAGDSVGVNENDDIFTREEAWAARETPVMKPFNWQHQDTDIVGVMYSVEARDTDGNVLDIHDATPPDCDFDLWVEAAIFSLVHENRATEIKARADNDSLYVSMEAWFDDYNYGFCEDDNLSKVVSRNKSTSYLDKHLRVSGGTGNYRDPESNQDVRIGRVLSSITFGGCGFVDRPANKRSVIDTAEPMCSAAERDTERQILNFLQNVESTEDILMNTNASNQDVNVPEVIGNAVDTALEKRAVAEAEVKAKADLEARATAAEDKVGQLETQVSDLTEAKETQVAEQGALEQQLQDYNAAVDSLVQDQTNAGATGDTPAEIAVLDGVSGGDSAFNAKISWISKSMATLRDRATRADELETQLAQAESVVREQEVRSLLGDIFSVEAVDAMVARASELDDDSYASWRDEKELMVIEMTTAKDDKEKKLPPFMKKGGDKDKDKDKDAKANVFEALLAQRRADSGSASPDTPPYEPHLINPNGDDGVKSGATPGSPGLSTPRHKIAGSAGDDLAGQLDNVQVDNSDVSLAGSNASDDGESVNGFRTLAGLVVDAVEEEEAKERPGFDPVK